MFWNSSMTRTTGRPRRSMNLLPRPWRPRPSRPRRRAGTCGRSFRTTHSSNSRRRCRRRAKSCLRANLSLAGWFPYPRGQLPRPRKHGRDPANPIRLLSTVSSIVRSGQVARLARLLRTPRLAVSRSVLPGRPRRGPSCRPLRQRQCGRRSCPSPCGSSPKLSGRAIRFPRSTSCRTLRSEPAST